MSLWSTTAFSFSYNSTYNTAGLGKDITVLFLYRPVAWCFIKRMKYLSILMVGVALATSVAADDLSKHRKWQSTSGHVLEAALVSFDSKVSTVRLKTTDGKEFDVQYNLLIHADQELLKQWEAANPFKRVDGAQKVVTNKTPVREVSADELEFREKIAYVKAETEPFTGTMIGYNLDGLKWFEMPYVNGKRHGTVIRYREDGSKWEETKWVNGLQHLSESPSPQISPVILKFINDFKARLQFVNPYDVNLLRTDTEHMQVLRNMLDDKDAWDYWESRYPGLQAAYAAISQRRLTEGMPAKEEISTKTLTREVPVQELKVRGGIAYFEDETEPFTGTAIEYFNGSKSGETPFVDGKVHGAWIMYHEDGSRMSEAPT